MVTIQRYITVRLHQCLAQDRYIWLLHLENDWFFATAQQHHVHHAHERRQADSNYGCMIILWDRIFGTYCGDTEVGQIGAGKAKPLSIKEQLLLAFYPTKRLIDL